MGTHGNWKRKGPAGGCRELRPLVSPSVAATPAAGQQYSLWGHLTFIQAYNPAASPIPSRVR